VFGRYRCLECPTKGDRSRPRVIEQGEGVLAIAELLLAAA
jgi:hypothetical protein